MQYFLHAIQSNNNHTRQFLEQSMTLSINLSKESMQSFFLQADMAESNSEPHGSPGENASRASGGSPWHY
jgi:hypothetical protein